MEDLFTVEIPELSNQLSVTLCMYVCPMSVCPCSNK